MKFEKCTTEPVQHDSGRIRSFWTQRRVYYRNNNMSQLKEKWMSKLRFKNLKKIEVAFITWLVTLESNNFLNNGHTKSSTHNVIHLKEVVERQNSM